MIKIVRDDLLLTDCDIIAHGVNTKGAFGSGIAGQIANKWPKVRAAYIEKHQLYGWQLGDVQLVYANYGLIGPIVANMATQENFGYDGKLYADYKAIEKCILKVAKYAYQNKMSIALPRVGCGLAGANWDKVKPIIECASEIYLIDIEVYEL